MSILSFVKAVKTIPVVSTDWPGCCLYRLAEHLPPSQKFCLLHDGIKNILQSGKVFEAAFYFERKNRTTREYKSELELVAFLVDLRTTFFDCVFTFLDNKSGNFDAFLDEELFSDIKSINELSSEGRRSIFGQNICTGWDPNC